MAILTRQKTVSRLAEAKKTKCPYPHYGIGPVMAGEFCGAWINDGSNDGRGRECHTPICRDCAEIRLQIWLCPKHHISKDKESDV